ncbi:hypothetical protein OXPF_39330 [Oxobacter pfennigii]|uniref:Uncharacterized protein n=1 Tax=Oxobacter pfennigii TaxID=36849 RepID=A0A0P9AAV4_9CLOT|nr:hypothetical protein [Oxobacter pfennigii]KPU42154.1 hypothetical protein OXPF_39330 [Oxobacter pfennigii]
MNLKGKVSSIEAEGVRVILIDRDNMVTPPLKKGVHIGTLAIGDDVAVMLFSENIADAIIAAAF